MDGTSPDFQALVTSERTHQRIDDPIAKESRALIRALEKKMHNELGLDVRVGLEKECKIHYQSIGSRDGNNDDDFTDAVKDTIRSARDRVKDTLNRDDITSPVHHFYREMHPKQYELTTTPASALQSVERMDAQCQQMERYAKDKKTIRHNENAYRISQVNFQPFSCSRADKALITSGLHVNISIWDKNTHTNQTEAISDDNKLAYKDRLYQYLCHDTLLVAPSGAAYDRIRGNSLLVKNEYVLRDNRNVFMAYKTKIEEFAKGERKLEEHSVERLEDSPARFEFRSPSSDARHDLSVLMTLTALYCSLKKCKEPQMDETFSKAASNYAEAVERFSEHSAMMADLAEVAKDDPALSGHVERLKEAITQAAQDKTLTQPTYNELAQVRGR